MEAVESKEGVKESEKKKWEMMKRLERIEIIKNEQRWREKRARN